VVSGDTLYSIAFRYDTDFRQLAILNNLRPPYSLRVGQILKVQATRHIKQPVQSTYRRPVSRPLKSPPTRPLFTPFSFNSKWLWPVKGRIITSFIPEQGKKGINIACNKGDKIRASSDGVVAYSGSGLAGYGNLLIIKHNNEYLTAYGNNARNLVSEGDNVKAGQIIAVAGLIERQYQGVHFEIRKKGVPVNPLNYLQRM
jgi:lipoprotein NlpD